MGTPLRAEGPITEDALLEEPLELTDADLRGDGLTAREIAACPEIGAWAEDPDVSSGAEYVEHLRTPSPRHAW